MSPCLLTLLPMLALTAAPAEPPAATPPQPWFGFVEVGSATGDDRGPSFDVMVSDFCHSDSTISTIVGPDWERAQPADPGDGWRDADYKWDWFHDIVDPYQDCGGIFLSYTHIDEPDWLELEYGSDEYWARVDHWLEAWFEQCAEAGIFYHIFENEPDGRSRSLDDWVGHYLKRLRHAYEAAKRADPRHQIIGGNMFSARSYTLFYERGFKDICDVVGFHNYSDNPHTGNDIGAVIDLRRIMEKYGDGDKQIFLGEGWGPGRELTSVTRTSPDEPITPMELDELRDFILNGYRNLTTKTETFDPAWILGAYFFTLNDNYGMWGWRERAKPVYDDKGRLITYDIDGYHVGLYLEPRFFNGGLATYAGVSKDTLLDLFPGNNLVLANPGFEYEERGGTPWAWETTGDVLVDRSLAANGQQSIRLSPTPDQPAVLEQALPDTMLAQAREGFDVFCTARALEGSAAPDLALEVVVDGNVDWFARWQPMKPWHPVSGKTDPLPKGTTVSIRVTASGSGVAWLDDIFIAPKHSMGRVAAYAYDQQHKPIPGVHIKQSGYEPTRRPPFPPTDENGRATLHWGQPWVGDLVAEAPGYESKTVPDVAVVRGVMRTVGFEMLELDPRSPAHVRGRDAKTGGTVLLEWDAPESGEVKAVRVHRSGSSLDLGEAVATITDATEWTDTGLNDGQNYCYTLMPVDGDGKPLLPVAEAQKHTVSVRPSYGENVVPYNIHEDADWDKAIEFAQTFESTEDCVLITARCIPAATNPILTFSIHAEGPEGEQIGPSREVAATRDQWAEARWDVGEIEMEKGRTYCLKIRGNGEWHIYHTKTDMYGGGRMTMDGRPAEERTGSGNAVDLWSTIRCTRHPDIHISDLATRRTDNNTVVVTWVTRLPVESRLVAGPEGGAQQVIRSGSLPTRHHRMELEDVDPETRFAVQAVADWRGLVTEKSPVYWVE